MISSFVIKIYQYLLTFPYNLSPITTCVTHSYKRKIIQLSIEKESQPSRILLTAIGADCCPFDGNWSTVADGT